MCLALSCLPSSLPLQKKKLNRREKRNSQNRIKKKKRNKTKKNNPIVFLVLCNYIAGVFFFVFQECVVISPPTATLHKHKHIYIYVRANARIQIPRNKGIG